MITRDEIIEIGVYNKPHGISGEISATFDYDIDMIKGLECFISDVNGIFVPFFAESIRTKNVTSVLMKLEGIEDDNSVKFLVNKEIYEYIIKTAFMRFACMHNGVFPLFLFGRLCICR